MVDLITGEAIVWNEEDKGKTYKVIDVPEDMVDDVNQYREELVEAVASYDEALMEKFFEDPDSITKEEMYAAIRSAVLDMSMSPVMCGSAFKNKGVQAVLDAVAKDFPGATIAAAGAKEDASEFKIVIAKEDGEAAEVYCDAEGNWITK